MATKTILRRQNNLGQIVSIDEVTDYQTRPIGTLEGLGGTRAGIGQMLGMLSGHSTMEGFCIKTETHEFLVLIDGMRSCCESWGHIHSADNVQEFIGAQLLAVRLTDTALNQTIIERHGCEEYGFHGGGIQFIDFITSKGKLQLAVYNSHNGYYGHGIVVAMDQTPLFEDTL